MDSTVEKKLPKCHLQLQWIYGVRMDHCRNHVQYLANGEIVYFAGKVAVVLSPQEQGQRFYFGHDEEITSIAQHWHKMAVATGQVGSHPYICVWDPLTMETVSILKDKHKNGISTLDFDKEGDRLISVGLEPVVQINVWSWKSGNILATCHDNCSRILSVQFCPFSKNVFVTTGVKSIKFWKMYGSYVDGQPGDFGKKGIVQTMLCVAFGINEYIYSGSLNGDIYLWKCMTLESVMKDVHRGGVITMHRNTDDNFVTGGRDGCIQLWTYEFKPLTRIDLNYTSDTLKGVAVRSVYWQGDKILIGTSNNKVLTISTRPSNDLKIVMQGPSECEHYAMAIHPHKLIFATGNGVGSLKLWNMLDKQIIHQVNLNCSLTSCCFNPNASHIAVGMQDGTVSILKSGDFSETDSIRESTDAISATKFSPDGSLLAVGNTEGINYIYNSYKGYKKVGQCCFNSSKITHMDWAMNNKYLHCNNTNKDSFVFRIPDGSVVKDKTELGSIMWSSWSTISGPEVTGFHAKYNNKMDIISADSYEEAGVIVTGNINGQLEIFRFPSYAKGARSRKYTSHSADVLYVFFSHDKSHLLSMSTRDKAIFQWSFTGESAAEMALNDERQTSKVQVDKFYDNDSSDDENLMDSDLAREMQTTYHRTTNKERIKLTNEINCLRHRLPDGKGRRRPPNEGLQLEFVFGYRGHDCRNNVYYTRFGSIVYHVAAVAIVYNSDTHKQKFYLGHSDDIICLALHPFRDIVATGQVGTSPSIHIWDCDTMTTLSILERFHQYGITALDFSGDGKFIVSIGLDSKHCVALWNWRRGELLAKNWGHHHRILTVKFNPNDSSNFATAGIKHLKFWTLVGNGYTTKRPIFGHLGKAETMAAITYGKSPGYCFSGGISGTIYVWDGCHLIRTLKAHEGPIFCLNTLEKGFLSGGKDGIIQLWDDYLDRSLRTYPVTKSNMMMGGHGQLVKDRPAIRACTLSHGKILAGTGNGEILQMERTGCFLILNQGHSAEELWALDVHPSRNVISTYGADQFVKTWDLDMLQMSLQKQLNRPGKCLNYSPDGKHLAIGFQDGCLKIVNSDTLDTVDTLQHRNFAVTAVKFSPIPRAFLAVGYQCGVVDVFEAFTWKWTMVCNTNTDKTITSLDWTQNSEILHVSTANGRQFFYEMPSGTLQVISVEHQNQLEWATWTSCSGLNCEKIWSPTGNSTADINATCLSGDGKLLAIADTFGFLRLIEFPITMQNPKSKWYFGHGPEVTILKWLDRYHHIVTVNKSDSAILVWNRRIPMVDRKTNFDSDETDSDELEDGFDSDVEKENNVLQVFKNSSTDGVAIQQDAQETMDETKSENGRHSADVTTLKPKHLIQFDNTGKPPQQLSKLELEYVFGYQGRGCSDNLHFLNEANEIVYSVASVAVVMNLITENQVFYQNHTRLITCLTVNRHPQFHGIVASGQLSTNPVIHLWSANTLESISLLQIDNDTGISSLSFSANGRLLLSVELDDPRTITVWRWEQGAIVARVHGYRNRIFQAQFRPDVDTHFVSVGVKHVKFWTLVGNQITGRKGVVNVDEEGQVGNNIAMRTMLSATFGKHDTTFTGASNGNIYVWKGHFLQRIIVKAHVGPVYVMHLTLKDGLITTGSKQFSGSNMDDAGIKLWDPEMRRCRPFPLRCAEDDIAVKSLARSKGKIILGTLDNSIHELVEKVGFVREVIHGHGRGGVFGVACHSHKQVIATTGEDQTVRIWDTANRKFKGKTTLQSIGNCLHFCPDGETVVAGLDSGQIVFISSTSFNVTNTRRDCNKPILDIKISPDGKYLAVAHTDGRVRIYTIHPGYQLMKTGYWKGSSAAMIKLDFSVDSQQIMITNQIFENIVIMLPEGYPILSEQSASIKWFTLSLFNPQMHLPSTEVANMDLASIRCSALSHSRNFAALGNDMGSIIVLPVTCLDKKGSYARRTCNSSAITCVQFTSHDRYVVTTEERNSSILIWRA